MAAAVGFVWQDYLVFATSLALTLGIGLYYGCRKNRKDTLAEYVMGNHGLWIIPVGLSFLMTNQSTITVIGLPADAYLRGMSVEWMHLIGTSSGCVVVALIFVPFIYPLKLTSAFEYLKRRYKSNTARTVGSGIEAIRLIGYSGTILFGVAAVLQTVSGLPIWATIVLTGAISIIYTALGGMRGVVWTDVLQCVIVLAALIATVVKGCELVGGFEEAWNLGVEGERIRFPSDNIDLQERHSWASLIVGGFSLFICSVTAQTTVQRINSLPSQRSAQWMIVSIVPVLIAITCMVTFIGALMFAYFTLKGCDVLAAKYVKNPNQLIVYFVMDIFSSMPGIPGLFLAAIFAAGLSSVSSALNSVAAITWEDALKWKFGYLPERKVTIVLKVLVAVFGIAVTGMAYLVYFIGGPIQQFGISILGATLGPEFAMFVVGALIPFTNWIGASVGGLCGCAITLWVMFGAATMPPFPVLPPGPLTNCSGASLANITAIPAMTTVANISAAVPAPLQGLDYLYSMSYLYIGVFSFVVTTIIMIFVSIVTYPCASIKSSDIDPECMISVADVFCCCLPLKARECLRCGVRQKDKVKEDKQELDTVHGQAAFDNKAYDS